MRQEEERKAAILSHSTRAVREEQSDYFDEHSPKASTSAPKQRSQFYEVEIVNTTDSELVATTSRLETTTSNLMAGNNSAEEGLKVVSKGTSNMVSGKRKGK